MKRFCPKLAKKALTEWAGKPQPKAIRFLLLLLLYGSTLFDVQHMWLGGE